MNASMTSIDEQFSADKQALAAACKRVAYGVLKSDHPQRATVATRLSDVGCILSSECAWDAQATAAASVRGLFHRDGIGDCPAPAEYPNWDADIRLLWDLSTIHVESRYREVATRQQVSERDFKGAF